MSQGFGQRPGVTRESLRAIQGVKDDSGSVGSGFGSVRRMALGIGAAALLVGVYVSTGRSSGPGLLDKYWKKSAAPVVTDAYVPIGVRDVHLEQANNTCKTRGENAVRGNSKPASSADAVMIRKSVAYVSCLAAESPRRLCQVAHRTHLLAAVKNHYRLQAKNRDAKPNADPQVVEALKAVIVNGYIPRRDVVAAGPSDLDAALRGIEPRKSGCGG